MGKAHELLVSLRQAGRVAERQHQEFLELCEHEKVPQATLYTPASIEGWYEMFRIYIFSKREDIRNFIWYFSPRCGLLVVDFDGKGVPLKEWDPDADLFFDESLHEGGTNMEPIERERRKKRD